MEGEGGQIPPCRITACKLDDAREKHEPEEKPPGQVTGQGLGIILLAGSPERPWNQKNRHQGALEEEGVPLKIEKDLPRRRQRQVKHPEKGEAGRLRYPENEKNRKRDPQPAKQVDEAAGSEYPAERGHFVP